MFTGTFHGCTGLTSLPAGLFSAINTQSATGTSYMFSGTFYGCSGLTSLPSGLFASIDTSSATDTYRMFYMTFNGCTGLTSLSAGLFGVINTSSAMKAGGMFYYTFSGCTGLTSLPTGLFSAINTSSATDTSRMFAGTFYNCTNMAGYIPPTTFPSTIVPGSSSSTNMWYQTFYNTQLATTCPAGTSQYITGFESDWGYSNENTSTSSCEVCSGTLPTNASYSNGCNWECDAGYYANNGACVACSSLGDGSWTQSVAGATEDTQCYKACANVAHATVTGNDYYGAGTDTCSIECDSGYAESGGTCTACPAKPENSSYTAGTCNWTCDSGYSEDNGECVHTACDTFTVTTTALAANTTISFMLSAAGVFNVDWGDGSTIQTIDRTGNTGSAETYSHTYTNAGTYTIGFCGTATAYHVADTTNDKPPITDTTISFANADVSANTKIASIGGSLGALFPTLNNGATQADQPSFYKTFQNCQRLTSIPAGLFTGITGSGSNMFRETFDRCSGLTSIPANLFAGVSGGAPNMFRSVFYSCSSLDGIPDGLFANITTAAKGEFKYAFDSCSSMSGYIPPTAFAGLIRNNSPTATDMFTGIFTGTNSLLTACPSGTQQYYTGYEGQTGWNSKVSCELTNPCTGATYLDSENANADANGCVACPTGYDADSSARKTSATQCKISCAAGTYLATANDTTCTNVGDGYYSAAELVAYGDIGTTRTACPDGRLTGKNNAASISECLVECTGTNYRNANNECVACPTGYTYNTTDGKTSATQCQIQCAAGYYLATANDAACSVVGHGYYSTAATVVNYGSTSDRTQCTNPEETTDLETATSESECKLLCTDATYFDANLNDCIACPTGYTAHTNPGKTSAAQCQIACAAGTYLAAAHDTNCIPVGDGYWSAASTVNYGSVSTRSQCPNGTQTGVNNASDASQCIGGCTDASYWDSTAGQCVACPTGYTDNTDAGKTSINQCQHMCAAGTYLREYTPVEYLQSAQTNVGNTTNFIDTGYEITSTSASGTVVVGTTTTPGSNAELGNILGNIYETGGISMSFKKNQFGLWMRDSTTNGAKATVTQTFTENTKFKVDFTATTTGTTTAATISVNDGTAGTQSRKNSQFNAAENSVMLFSGGSAYINNGTVTLRYGDKLFPGRIYSMTLYDGGNLALDLIPVRRNFDNALGFYNRVNGEFYTNSGTGTFTAGDCTVDVGDASTACDPIITCSPVEFGYWANQSYNNYGSAGVRNRCPNDGGTFINSVETNTAGSIYNCEGIDPCTGATYPNPTTGVCTACPNGYDADTSDNKEVISQCRINCAAGTYLAEAHQSTCTAVETGYWSAGGYVEYGSFNEPHSCTAAPDHSDYTGSATSNSCPWACDAKYYADNGSCVNAGTGYYSPDLDNNRYACTNEKPAHSSYTDSATSNACPFACDAGYYASGGACIDPGVGYFSPSADDARYACTNEKPTHSSYSGSATSNNCPWQCDTGYVEENGACVEVSISCTGATYLDNEECVACPTGYDANTTAGKVSAEQCQINCGPGTHIATANDTTCTNVGAGFWAAGGLVSYGSTSAKTACTDGLTTIGYGHGADEAGDCGYAMNIGGFTIYARSMRKTRPSLNIKTSTNDVFYVSTSATNHSLSSLHFRDEENEYTAYDDSLYYNERPTTHGGD